MEKATEKDFCAVLNLSKAQYKSNFDLISWQAMAQASVSQMAQFLPLIPIPISEEKGIELSKTDLLAAVFLMLKSHDNLIVPNGWNNPYHDNVQAHFFPETLIALQKAMGVSDVKMASLLGVRRDDFSAYVSKLSVVRDDGSVGLDGSYVSIQGRELLDKWQAAKRDNAANVSYLTPFLSVCQSLGLE